MVLAPAPFATATLQAEALKGNAGSATNGIAGNACIRRSLRTRFQEHDGIKMGMYVVFILSTTNIKPVITDLTGYGNLPQAALRYDWLYSAVVTTRPKDLCHFYFLKMHYGIDWLSVGNLACDRASLYDHSFCNLRRNDLIQVRL